MAEHAHEYPFCSRLIAGFERPWVLYVAAMFHDIAKGRGGDHSLLGMRDARRFCRDYGITDDDADLVVFLVGHHLSMSALAQKQDLTDPDIIRGISSQLRDTNPSGRATTKSTPAARSSATATKPFMTPWRKSPANAAMAMRGSTTHLKPR